MDSANKSYPDSRAEVKEVPSSSVWTTSTSKEIDVESNSAMKSLESDSSDLGCEEMGKEPADRDESHPTTTTSDQEITDSSTEETSTYESEDESFDQDESVVAEDAFFLSDVISHPSERAH